MADSFDVIVVGARCAGAPLAAMLARRGVSVALLERATFPRDTLSTHVFEAEALSFLDRLGVIDRIRATGAPMVDALDLRLEDFHVRRRIPQRPGDVGGVASVRRFLLDPILADAAAEAGAEVRMGSVVSGLVRERGRVAGVRVGRDEPRARLVIGADGRNSTVAKLVGARKYNLTPNERFGYWSFFEGARIDAEPAIAFHRWDSRLVIGLPSDSALYEVVVLPELRELPAFRADLEGSYLDYARGAAPVAEAIDGARRVGRIFGMLRWEGFFREPSGPGWALAGDAGHFKDPAPGQGIQDAFRQVEELVPAIVRGLGGSDGELDEALAEWGRWRDEDAAEHYWLAVDFGKAGPLPAVLPAVARRLHERGALEPFLDILNHRAWPSQVVTPLRTLGTTARLLARPGTDRRALVREVRGLVAEDMRRRRLAKRPRYAPAGTAMDAGETEVEAVAA